jgi:hypothetical protein
LESLTSAYYCWRANTAKMQNLLAESFPDDHAQPAEIQAFLTSQVAADFLNVLAQVLPGEGVDPKQIFHSYALTEAHIQQRVRALEKNIASCVEKAVQLFSDMRLGRCHYAFQRIHNGPFHTELTEIYSGQRDLLPKNEALNKLVPKLKIEYCVYPALVKYGDNYGKNFHLKEVLTPAQVVVGLELSSDPDTNDEKSISNTGKEKKSLVRKGLSMLKTAVLGDDLEADEEDSIEKRLSEDSGAQEMRESDNLPRRLDVIF